MLSGLLPWPTGFAAIAPLRPFEHAFRWAFLTYVTWLGLGLRFRALRSAALWRGARPAARLVRLPAGRTAGAPVRPILTLAIFWATVRKIIIVTLFLVLKWRALLSAARCILDDVPHTFHLRVLPTGGAAIAPVRPLAHNAIFWATHRGVWAGILLFNQGSAIAT